MASAKKCDVCNRFYEQKRLTQLGYVKILTYSGIPLHCLDVCPSCMDKLLEFLGLELDYDESDNDGSIVQEINDCYDEDWEE